MKTAPNNLIEPLRDVSSRESLMCKGQNAGMFRVRSQSTDADMLVIASDGGKWDHVSVSIAGRCPLWHEMCQVKNMFFKDEEVVMQLHPAKSTYVNEHPFTLHLWRPQSPEESAAIAEKYGDQYPTLAQPWAIPLPPIEMV